MVVKAQFNPEKTALSFTDFPNHSFPFKLEEAAGPNWVCLEIEEQGSKSAVRVFLSADLLRGAGIAVTQFKQLLSLKSPKISEFFQTTQSVLDQLLACSRIADAALGRKWHQLSSHVELFARLIVTNIVQMRDGSYSAKDHKLPAGIYVFSNGKQVFINMKGINPIGRGVFSVVKPALQLFPPALIAKKRAAKGEGDWPAAQQNDNNGHLDKEARSLVRFLGQRGIIQILSSGLNGDRRVTFFPFYPHSLLDFALGKPVAVSDPEKKAICLDWLHGLVAISQKGTHGDIKPANLLFRAGEKPEGAISDFGTFHTSGVVVHGYSTPQYAPPEYFALKVSSKHDVWSMALSIWEFYRNHAEFFFPYVLVEEAACKTWVEGLKPGWCAPHLERDKVPLPLRGLLEAMLHPDPGKRISAEESLKRFCEQII